MPRGTLQVFLVNAKGLEDTDIFNKMDPYVVLTCRTQEHKSGIAWGMGSAPEWNETFLFTITEGVSELNVKIMDSDRGTEDDFVGEAMIHLEPAFMSGRCAPMAYNVVRHGNYRGKIKIGLEFFPEEGGYDGELEESIGGWKHSSFDY